jgi:plastocyanin
MIKIILLFIFFSIPIFNYYGLGWGLQDSLITITINPGATNSDSQNPIAPTNVTVSEGTTIIWFNDDSTTHQLVSGTPDQGPSNIFYGDYFGAGESYNTTIDNAGIYNYYDPSWSHIRGQITVIPHNDTDLEANDGRSLNRTDTGVTAE